MANGNYIQGAYDIMKGKQLKHHGKMEMNMGMMEMNMGNQDMNRGMM